ncbi:MAG TPA: hypothetical protein VHM02_04765 [Thermoanaerobaculia bacterium]|nr:hypothetical protein [Thermoanaerobaculia bacterium]
MRSTLLAACLVCLALVAAPAVADVTPPEAAIAPAPAVAAAERPAPAPAEPAPALFADAETCPTAPQATSLGFGTWCGDPCSDPAGETFCTGYDCSGTMRIASCYCSQSRWYCQWQECPPGGGW